MFLKQTSADNFIKKPQGEFGERRVWERRVWGEESLRRGEFGERRVWGEESLRRVWGDFEGKRVKMFNCLQCI